MQNLYVSTVRDRVGMYEVGACIIELLDQAERLGTGVPSVSTIRSGLA